MNTYKQFYQDTVTQITDTSAYQSTNDPVLVSDTIQTIEDTVKQTTAKETVKRKTVSKKSEAIKEEVKITKDKVEIIQENTAVDIDDNFLKLIDKNKTESKAEEVFIDQSGQSKYSEISDIGTGRNLATSDWVLPIILVSIGIMIWIRKSYIRQVELLFNSIYNYQMSLKLFKDQSSRFLNFSIVLNFNSALTVALFLFQLSKFYKTSFIDGGEIVNYLAIVLFLFTIYILQIVAYSLLGQILNSQDDYNEFIHHTYSLIKVLGIVVIPIVIVNAYASEIILPYFLIFGLIIIVYFYFKRIQRGILILMQKQFLKVHQILYFCTLEILPLLVISKFVNSLIERSF